MTNLERVAKYYCNNLVSEEVYTDGQFTINKEWLVHNDEYGRNTDKRIPNTTIYSLYDEGDYVDSYNTLKQAKIDLETWK